MALQGNTDRLMSDINVTPFVDVMLVLLIIFMVTAPMMTQGVDVDLPKVTAQPLPQKQDQLIITINSNNEIYINEYPVSLLEITAKLETIFQNRQNREVFLKADKTVLYGTVVHVMSGIKAAGVDKLGLVTTPDDETKKDKDDPSSKKSDQ